MAVFDLELTISGLCVVVMTADEDRPRRPVEVDILAVEGCGEHVDGESHQDGQAHQPDQAIHKPRFSFWPDDANPWDDRLRPYLHVDPMGQKQATVDLADWPLISLDDGSEDRACRVEWADGASIPSGSASERHFDWVPSVYSLGLTDGVRVPQGPMDVPTGAIARLKLPGGELYARSVVRTGDGDPIAWSFPAMGTTHAIANEVVFHASGVHDVLDVIFSKPNGGPQVTLELLKPAMNTLCLGFNNDVERIAKSEELPRVLDHLRHLESLALGKKKVTPPTAARQPVRTGGGPICDQAFTVKPTGEQG